MPLNPSTLLPEQVDGDIALLRKIAAAGGASAVGGAGSGGDTTPTIGHYVVGNIPPGISVTFQRPNNTTAYASGDVVGQRVGGAGSSLLVFANIARAAGLGGYIQRARLVKDGAVVTDSTFRLMLFHTIPVSVGSINDNDPYQVLWANRDAALGWIDFPTLTSGGAGSDAATTFVAPANLPFCTRADPNLYGILLAQAAYTPIANERFFVEITPDRY